MPKTAYLILENGKIFEGKAFGAEREALGEIVFNTGMTGYLENLTSKSSYGQVILQTFPLVGNYGKITEDFESDSIKASAYIVKSWCEEPSNFRCEGNLDTFLKSEGIPGIYGVDTRELTKIIRESGAMNCMVAYSRDNIDFEQIKNYKVAGAVESVSCRAAAEFKGARTGAAKTVALVDFGLNESIKARLVSGGCNVWLVPHNTGADKIKELGADGVLLSSGPGDPADNAEAVANIRDIVKLGLPVFGIGLGHQLLALAHGFRTHKLKHGHRGASQPVKDLSSGRVYTTVQNHGYSVELGSIDKSAARVLLENVNDKSCEGLEYSGGKIFSCEFYPEAYNKSERNTSYLYDRFIDSMK